MTFPFSGSVELVDPETGEQQVVNAADAASDYRKTVEEVRGRLQKECQEMRIDYVPLDTSNPMTRR